MGRGQDFVARIQEWLFPTPVQSIPVQPPSEIYFLFKIDREVPRLIFLKSPFLAASKAEDAWTFDPAEAYMMDYLRAHNYKKLFLFNRIEDLIVGSERALPDLLAVFAS